MTEKRFRRRLRRKQEFLAPVIPSVAKDPGLCRGNPGSRWKQNPRSPAALGMKRAISLGMTGMNVAAGGQS
jgi:hypothetical protein